MSYIKEIYGNIQADIIDIMRDYGIEDPDIDMVNDIIECVVEESK